MTAGRRQEVKAAETNRLHPQAALGSCILLCKRGALQTTRQPAHLDWSSAARSAAETLLLQYLWSSRCRGRYWREGSLAPAAAGAPLAPRCAPLRFSGARRRFVAIASPLADARRHAAPPCD